MSEAEAKSGDRENKIRRFIDRMPSLPTTVTKVLEVCNRPDTSANDLNRVISLDPVLTGQVLKLINSAYYSLPNHIGSLTRAIILLGINTVKNLALSTAVLGSMSREDSFHSLQMDAFWTHSLGVGVTAKALATHRGVESRMREEFFVAGLLHDLGKIPLNACYSQLYREALELAQEEKIPLNVAELRVLNLDHGEVGRMIGEKWQLNSELVELMAGHHRPEEMPPEVRPLAGLIGLADAYVNLQEIGSAGNLYPDKGGLKKLLVAARMSWQNMLDLTPEVGREIEKARVFLAVAGKKG